jgi:para-nitrobenzyl esterase
VSGPVVETTAGRVRGDAFEGYERFLGIPYAEAARFRPPEPPKPWQETRAADRFGPHAPQLPSVMEQFFAGANTKMVIDEHDCLRLNVWTPSAGPGDRPVMVWIHGGAFTMGSASSPWYDGARFAVDHDVVVVSLNYRLGVLGFTHLEGGDFPGSGGLGIQDQVAALRWVRDNIAAFGGDPGNVTIFGESAGAMSVGTLLAVPSAAGLFHKAILQSGAPSHVLSAAHAAELSAELLRIAGASSVQELVDMPLDDLLEAHQTLGANHVREGLVSRPVVDGVVLEQPPLEAVAAGASAEIPLLIGTNFDEWKLFSIVDPSMASIDDADLLKRASEISPEPDAFIGTYRHRLAEAKPVEVWNAIMSDSVFRVPAIRLAEAQGQGGGRSWMYLFTWASPQFDGALGSCHALELPFVFNTLDAQGSSFFVGDDPPRALARDLNATWAAFARFGEPSRGALGNWPGYETSGRKTMVIDVASGLESDPLGEERQAWSFMAG